MIFFGARKEAKRISVSLSRIRHKSFGLSEVENSVAFPCSKQIPLGVPFGREWYGICFFFRCSPECQLLRFQITLICCFAEAKQPAPGLSPRVSVESVLGYSAVQWYRTCTLGIMAEQPASEVVWLTWLFPPGPRSRGWWGSCRRRHQPD